MFSAPLPPPGMESVLGTRSKRTASYRVYEVLEQEKAGGRRSGEVLAEPSLDGPGDAADLRIPLRRRGAAVGGRTARRIDLNEVAALEPVPQIRQNYPFTTPSGDALRDLAAAYALIRAFSFSVKLSPFTFEQLCNALVSPHPTVLCDEVRCRSLRFMSTLPCSLPNVHIPFFSAIMNTCLIFFLRHIYMLVSRYDRCTCR